MKIKAENEFSKIQLTLKNEGIKNIDVAMATCLIEIIKSYVEINKLNVPILYKVLIPHSELKERLNAISLIPVSGELWDNDEFNDLWTYVVDEIIWSLDFLIKFNSQNTSFLNDDYFRMQRGIDLLGYYFTNFAIVRDIK